MLRCVGRGRFARALVESGCVFLLGLCGACTYMSGNDVINIDALYGATDPCMVIYNSCEIVRINMFGIAFV